MNANNNNNLRTGHPPQTGGGSTGFQPIRILVRRRWQLFACLLLVCAMALASAFLVRPAYHAVSQVQVVSDSPDNLGGLADLLGGSSGGDYFETQCKLITSRKILSDAARRMNNATEWAYNDSVYDAMKSKVQVVPISQSRLIEIVGIGETPSEAAAISNQVTAAFVDSMTSDYKADTQRVVRRICAQIDSYEKSIAGKESLLGQYRQDHKITSAAAVTREAEAQVAQLEKDLSSLRLQQHEAENKKVELERLLSNPTLLESGQYYLKELTDNSSVNDMDNQIRQLIQDEARLARIYLPGHNRLKLVREKLNDLRQARKQVVTESIQTLYQQVTDTLESNQVREKTIGTMLSEARDRCVKLAGYQSEYSKMTAELSELVNARKQLEQTLRKFEISESMKEAPVVVVDAAHLPTKPVGLSAEHRAASILLLGLVFSVVFVLSVERLTAQENQESNLQRMPAMIPWNGWAWPNLAAVPTQTQSGDMHTLGRIGRIESASGDSDRAVAARCRIVHIDAAGTASNGFREVSSRLLSRFGRSHQSMLITGSSTACGKTTCASNLALSIHQSRRQVVLVDINPQYSPLSKAFQYNRKILDLSLFYDDSTILDNYLSDTEMAGLTILSVDSQSLPAGTTALSALSTLQGELASRYDWVIYDAGTIGHGITDRLMQTVGKAIHVTGINDLDTPEIVMEQIENRGAVCVGTIDNRFYQYAPHRDAVKV